MNITGFRKAYPQYNDMDDATVATNLHQRYYSDMPYEDFAQKFGVSISPKQSALAKIELKRPDSPPSGPTPEAATPGVGETAVRALKQIGNIPREIVRGTVANVVDDIHQQLNAFSDNEEDSKTKPAVEGEPTLGQKVAEGVPVPGFNVKEPVGALQRASDFGVGTAKFVGEIAALQLTGAKLLGAAKAAEVPVEAYWALHAYMNGGNPWEGAAQGAAFHQVGKMASKSAIETGMKILANAGLMGAITKVSGGSPEDIATSTVAGGLMSAGGVRDFVKGRAAEKAANEAAKAAPRYAESPEPLVIATAEMTQGPEMTPAPEGAPETPTDAEVRARMEGQWRSEIDERNAAYERLQDAAGTRNKRKVANAQKKYDRLTLPSQEQLQVAAQGGDPDAMARLKGGFFEGGKPEPKAEEAAPGTRTETPRQDENKTELDRDIDETHDRMDEIAKKAKVNKEGKVRLNVWGSARYILRDFDAITGTDTASWIEKVDRRANIEAPDEVTQHQREVMERHGLGKDDAALPVGEVAQHIEDALYSGDMSKLTPDELKYYPAAKELLDYGGEIAARRKWQMWKNGIEVPGGIAGDKGMAESILAAGKKAETDGKLDEWLKTQPWAKREVYFMSEKPRDVTGGDSESLFRDGPPTISGREAKTRGEGARVRHTDNLFASIHDHLLNLARSEAANDEIPQIWKRVKGAGFDAKSEAAMKDLLKNVAGIGSPSYGIEHLAISGKLWFWRLKFLNPRFVYRFAVENVTQLLYMKTQMSTAALAKGAAIVGSQKYAGTRDTYRLKEAERLWGGSSRQNQMFVAQLRDAGNEFRQNHPEIWKASRPLMNTVDALVHAASSVDPMVRELSWHVYDTAAKDYLSRFQRGEITWKQVEAHIQIKTLHPGQADSIYYRIKRGEIDKASSMIAEAKTSATHARYEVTQRSLTEQTKAMRVLTGPLTYTRSLYEMAWHQGVKPIQDGLARGDYMLAYRGFKNIGYLGIGFYVANKTFEKATGRPSPLMAGLLIGRSPGLDFIVGPLDEVSNIAYQAERQQWTAGQQASRTAEALSNRLELTIPLADMMSDYYEKQHNVQGVHLWGLIREELYRRWRIGHGGHKWQPAGRTEREGWQHLITGGIEEGTKLQQRKQRRQEAK